MAAIINVILPVFAIMLAGYLAGRLRLIGPGGSEPLSRFVFYIAMPALIFISLARTPVGEFFNMPFLGALGGGMLAVFVLSMLVARFAFPGRLADLGLHGLAAMFSSTAYVGIPLLLTAYGEAAIVPGIIGAVITGACFLPIAIILAEFDLGRARSARGGWRRVVMPALGGVFKNPPLLATAAGLAVAALGIPVPRFAATFCDMLGGAFGPAALFAAGLFMAGQNFRAGAAEVGWLVVVKLVLHPLLTWWLAFHVFGLEGVWAAAAVIHAALPIGVPVFVTAQRYGTFVERSGAAIMVSTVVSVATLSVVLILLGAG